jgi:hypothetical protein
MEPRGSASFRCSHELVVLRRLYRQFMLCGRVANDGHGVVERKTLPMK